MESAGLIFYSEIRIWNLAAGIAALLPAKPWLTARSQ